MKILALSPSHQCLQELANANLLSDVLTIVKPLLFTNQSSVSLSRFKEDSFYPHTVVVKSYVKQKLTSLQREQVGTEAHLLSCLAHDHVAPLLAAVEDPKAIHLIIPWCDGGDLRQHLASLRCGGGQGHTHNPTQQGYNLDPSSYFSLHSHSNQLASTHASARTSALRDQGTSGACSILDSAATTNSRHNISTCCGSVNASSKHGSSWDSDSQTGLSYNSNGASTVETRLRDFLLHPLLRALALLQQQGVVHRDISPKNILVHQGMVKLSDFGMAVCLQPPSPAAASSSSQEGGEQHGSGLDSGSGPSGFETGHGLIGEGGSDCVAGSIVGPQAWDGGVCTETSNAQGRASNLESLAHNAPSSSNFEGGQGLLDRLTSSAPARAHSLGSADSEGCHMELPELSRLSRLGNASLQRQQRTGRSSTSNGGTVTANGGSAGSPGSVDLPASSLAVPDGSMSSSACSTGMGSVNVTAPSSADSSGSEPRLGNGGCSGDDVGDGAPMASVLCPPEQQQALPFNHQQSIQQQQQQQQHKPQHQAFQRSSLVPRTRSSPELMSSVNGTPLYAAPEVLQAVFRNQQVKHAVHHKNDVWALGVIAVEALTGRHPFSQGGIGVATQGGGPSQGWCPGYGSSNSNNETNMLFSISTGQPLRLPAQLSPACADLLGCMLQRDPARRATAAQLLKHPFINQQAGVLAHKDFSNTVSFLKERIGQLPPRPPLCS